MGLEISWRTHISDTADAMACIAGSKSLSAVCPGVVNVVEYFVSKMASCRPANMDDRVESVLISVSVSGVLDGCHDIVSVMRIVG